MIYYNRLHSTPRTARMPPRTISPAAIEAMIVARVAAALASNETQRQQSLEQGENSRGSGGNPRTCNYKDFLTCKPSSFYGIGGMIELTRWFEKTESVIAISNCTEESKVKFVACTFVDSALTWWNGHVQAMGLPAANALIWEELKAMLLEEYCPRGEVQKIEQDFWNLTMKGSEIQAYTTPSRALSRDGEPGLQESGEIHLKSGPHIQSHITTANPATFENAKALDVRLTDEGIRHGATAHRTETLKWENNKRKSWMKNKPNPTPTPQNKQQVITAFAATAPTNTAPQKTYGGTLPKCNRCNYHHVGACKEMFCTNCKKKGHTARFCKSPAIGPAQTINAGAGNACYGCGDVGHFKRECLKAAGTENGRVFGMGTKEALDDPRCVTGTFLINNLYATVLFDSGTERSFMNHKFRKLLTHESQKLNDTYIVAMANGHIESTNEILPNCTLTLNDHTFHVDLMPMTIGSFDVIIGMDWLELHHADVMCYEKAMRLNLPNGDKMIVYGDKSGDNLRIISYMKAQKYLHKKCYAFLAHIVDKSKEPKKIQDIPQVCGFPDVFPEDLPGLPPT
ncbi:hypothetical protein LXL04_003603 [Taraxacum kok-saghyz]